MKIFHNRNQELENEIELYLDSLHNTCLYYYEGIKNYLDDDEKFINRVNDCSEKEREADEHLRNIKYILYRYNLIPDLSADILELMDACDDIGDVSKAVLLDLDAESPKIEDEMKPIFREIAKLSTKSAETVISGIRFYLTQMNSIEERINKVYFYESEVDKLQHELKKIIYKEDNGIEYARKNHLTYFVKKCGDLSDVCEGIAIKLSVFQFKRGI
jgi:predicted phosphate transport protein (TIGR00153 family)